MPPTCSIRPTGPQLEQVRRAIIDGRPGMPKGLLGGSDVDQIAAYLSGEKK